MVTLLCSHSFFLNCLSELTCAARSVESLALHIETPIPEVARLVDVLDGELSVDSAMLIAEELGKTIRWVRVGTTPRDVVVSVRSGGFSLRSPESPLTLRYSGPLPPNCHIDWFKYHQLGPSLA